LRKEEARIVSLSRAGAFRAAIKGVIVRGDRPRGGYWQEEGH